MVLWQFFRHTPREKLIRIGFFAAGIFLGTYALVNKFGLPIIPTSVIFITIIGVANAFLDIPVNTMIQENTPEEVRSRVYGVVSSVIGLAGVFPIVF